MSFFGEIKRRKVMQVAAVYAVVAWLLIQIVSTVEAPLNLPNWADTLVIVILAVGLPVALIMSWAYDLTPAGLVRDEGRDDAPAADVDRASGPIAQPAIASRSDPRPSIAVLPFVDMSPDRDQEYFSDGLSEELLNAFAQLQGLRVIARTSSFAFKGQNPDARDVGKVLGVAHVLEGSVRKAGDDLRITAQLIDTSDGSHLWSKTYARRLDDVFAIQEEISAAVAKAMSVTLGIGESTAAMGLTEDVETYQLYLHARALFNRNGPDDLVRAAALYRKALARDPDFSRALAGLVHTYAWSLIYIPDRRAEIEQALAEATAEARARAPDDWATYLATALLHMVRYEWVDAEAAFARAASLAPGPLPEVNENMTLLYIDLGRIEDALAAVQATRSSDPLSANVSFFIQFGNFMLGRKDAWEAEYRRSLDLPGTDAREDIPHMALLQAWNGGDAALIEARFDTYLARWTIPTQWIRDVRAVYDDPHAALAVIRAAYDDRANHDPTRLQFVASYAGHYGDQDLAVAAMRRAVVDLRGLTVSGLWWRDMAAARRLPAFKDLVREIGLVDYWRRTGNWGSFCRPVGSDDFECF